MRRPIRLSCALLIAALLGGCAGSGGSPASTPTASPSRTASSTPSSSATASPTASATQPTSTATPIPSTPTASATATASATPTPPAGEAGAIAPLGSAGRWFIDAIGRVVLLHGVNMVSKSAPFYPAAFGFGADDAAFLADEGFSAVRLGVDLRGVMPTPGAIDDAYIEHLAETVDVLRAQGLFILLDFHQDGFAPKYNGNGFPDWLAIDDGLENPPDAVFPLYYIQNPAMQRAFESFWADRPGPNDVGLQTYFLQAVERVTARFAAEPLVLGVELMNEPWPGAEWGPCALEVNGCPQLEQQRLMPFYRRGAAVVREQAPRQLTFVEPFVLFNFGQAATSMPGTDPGLALSFHSYAIDVAGELGVLANAVAAATRDGAPLLLTEFGASTDPVPLLRLTAQFESALLPWMYWTYDESIIDDLSRPAGDDNLANPESLAALVRPYPLAVTGTPTSIAFDPATGVFDLTYDTAAPPGVSYARNAVSVIDVPRRHYPGGYAVTLSGATVTSAACATRLTLRNQPGATQVVLHVVPADSACP
ncbi:MAG: cellulase family glycosylhydrolase [Deltaproteobacteria bacterium]|nr:cellulase family glycosylhydrolase [Deltaproteobacteria bacterium]